MKRNKGNIQEMLEWGKYVSPRSDIDKTPFNWYAFKHRFGSELVSKIFNQFGLAKGSIVFDPFCGGGTTLIKAKQDGYNSVGLDISPFSVFLTNALLNSYKKSKLLKTLANLSHTKSKDVPLPDVSILKSSFSMATLKYIFSLCASIKALDIPEKDFFLLSLFSILNCVSKTKKSGGFLRITEQRKATVDTVRNKFIEISNKYISELDSYKMSDAFSIAYIGDARKYPKHIRKYHYDAILTSPPYPNRHDYTRIYELELLTGFINSNQELKSLRYSTLRSHVEAKVSFIASDYIAPKMLEERIALLEERQLNNRMILSTLSGYFEDMYLCIKEMHSVLRSGGHIGIVVSNVRFAGVMFPVDELLSEIGEQVGLRSKGIYVLRYRGNSSQQMSEYEKEPARESLVLWQKK